MARYLSNWRQTFTSFAITYCLAALLIACSPTVKVEAPDKPIVINLNVKIEQEVRIKVERDAEALLEEAPELF